MKRLTGIIVALLFAAGMFLAGNLFERWSQSREGKPHSTGRKILYYVDAMHPWYKSDKPGIAPDCGMKLEPVYADEKPAVDSAGGRPFRNYPGEPRPAANDGRALWSG